MKHQLVLSLFPGIDLLGRAFEDAGFVIVRGPDLITGGDIRDFAGISGRFDGVIGGPPCQGFSVANVHRKDPNHPSVVNSRTMLAEFCRVVEECNPMWFLCENVPNVPDVIVPGFEVQRFPLSDRECGGPQLRIRHFQYGHRSGHVIRPQRSVSQRSPIGRKSKPTTTKTSKWKSYPDQCKAQGLSCALELAGMHRSGKFKAVGNGVSMHVGRVLAAACSRPGVRGPSDCPCGCGRMLVGRQRSSTASCRKRLQLDRERARPSVSARGYVPGRDLAACVIDGERDVTRR